MLKWNVFVHFITLLSLKGGPFDIVSPLDVVVNSGEFNDTQHVAAA